MSRAPLIRSSALCIVALGWWGCTSPKFDLAKSDSADNSKPSSETTTSNAGTETNGLSPTLEDIPDGSEGKSAGNTNLPGSEPSGPSGLGPETNGSASAPGSSSPDSSTDPSSDPSSGPGDPTDPDPENTAKVSIQSTNADGLGCVLMGFGKNAKLTTLKSQPEGETDVFQIDFEEMELSSEGWVQEAECAVLVELRWDAGSRVVFGLKQEGSVYLSRPNPSTSVTMLSQINFDRGHGVTKTEEYKQEIAEKYSFAWNPVEIGAYSDCSGSGRFSLLVQRKISGTDNNTKFSVSLDQLSGLFRIARKGEGNFPNCD